MIIDTHVHYNLEPLYSGQEFDQANKMSTKSTQIWRRHWEKAQQNGVSHSIVIGTNVMTSVTATQIAGSEKNIFASVGIHPSECVQNYYDALASNVALFDTLFDDIDLDVSQIEHLANEKKVVAIGEVGLDYYRLPKDLRAQKIIVELQKHAFERQLSLAKKHHLPVVIHVRDQEVIIEPKPGNAYWDALSILQSHNVQQFTLHCVSGPIVYVQAAIEMGGYMGFDGNLTYKNAQAIRDIFAIVPEHRRLVETDAPYLPPQEFRGKVCEPWMISKTVEYIEKELKFDPDRLIENSKKLFQFD